LAVGAGIGTGLTVFKAFLAVSDLHFLAFDIGFAIRMKSAFHDFDLKRGLLPYY